MSDGELKCPRDEATLVRENYEGEVLVDRCPSCRGLWLDRGELERIQETLERDYSEKLARIDTVARAYAMARQKARPEIDCPRCGTALHAEEYAYCSQILIDRCGRCGGVWLDAGEMEELERFFEGEREAHEDVRKSFLASLFAPLS